MNQLPKNDFNLEVDRVMPVLQGTMKATGTWVTLQAMLDMTRSLARPDRHAMVVRRALRLLDAEAGSVRRDGRGLRAARLPRRDEPAGLAPQLVQAL
jgi:hypothetical protein